MPYDFEFEDDRQSLISAAVKRDICFPDGYSEDDMERTVSDGQYRRLVEELVDAALKQGMPLRGAVGQASNIVRAVRDAVVDPLDGDVENQLNFWSHVDDTKRRVRTADFPDLYREKIVAAAAVYLQAPIRSQKVDRLLADLLVAAEYFSYAKHVCNTPFVRVRHPLSAYLRGRIRWALCLSAVTAMVALMWSDEVVSFDTASWIILAGVALFGIDAVTATIALPIALAARVRGRGTPTSADLLTLMERLYRDLKSDGLISATAVREKAKKADERGVGWSAALFVLLDDIAARSGRF